MSFAKNLNKYSFHPCVFTIEPMLCNQNDLLVHILQVFHGVDYRDEIIDYHRSLAQSSEPQRDHALPSGMDTDGSSNRSDGWVRHDGWTDYRRHELPLACVFARGFFKQPPTRRQA